jgi:hypothetical protein
MHLRFMQVWRRHLDGEEVLQANALHARQPFRDVTVVSVLLTVSLN